MQPYELRRPLRSYLSLDVALCSVDFSGKSGERHLRGGGGGVGGHLGGGGGKGKKQDAS